MSNLVAKPVIGKKRWAIAEGYVPGWSHGPNPEMQSHEAVCILNAGAAPAKIELTVFFKDREPAGPYLFELHGRRTLHIRMNSLQVPEVLPLATDYSCVIESDVAVVVQHSRLDSRQSENALMTTIAYSQEE